MTHEQTPWQIEGTPEKGGFFISTMHPSPLFQCKWFVGTPDQAKANATFIVKAVNAHDELVAALVGMTKLYVDLVNCGDCGYWDAEEEEPVKASRAALIKAGATS